MSIKKEKIVGDLILNEYASTNLKSSEYNTITKDLLVEFTKGGKYTYNKVPIDIFTKMRTAESQGSYFAKNIAKNYKYKKMS
jgi:hypothetical protein|tara:strand:+ start:1447 stop:1692 length:246 start_codon:yes stop_codon:yes gene_type:complete